MAPRPEPYSQNKDSLTQMMQCRMFSSDRRHSQSSSNGDGNSRASSISTNDNLPLENEKMKVRVGEEIVLESGARFLIKEKLGFGTYGQVFKIQAHDFNLALKTVKVQKEERLSSALREVTILDFMRPLDPGDFIPANYHSFCLSNANETIFCHISELLQKPLADVLDKIRGNAFHPKIVKAIGFQILCALERLHSFGITHCDIKPDNIMFVNMNTHKLKVKLIDFGNSHFTCKLPRGAKMQNMIYRSPEVLFGLPLNEKLDIWGVACMLFEMFTGEDLFPVDEEPQLARFIRDMVGLPFGVENGSRSPLFMLPDERKGGLRPITYKESREAEIDDCNLDTRKIRILCGIPQLGFNYRTGLGKSIEDHQFEELLISMLAADVDARAGASEALHSLYFRSFDGNFNPDVDGIPYTTDVETAEVTAQDWSTTTS